MCLRAAYAVSGTEIAYGAMRFLRGGGGAAGRGQSAARYVAQGMSISLRACYAMSGTDIRPPYAMPGTGLRACYAMPGTAIVSGSSPRACYAMPGTDVMRSSLHDAGWGVLLLLLPGEGSTGAGAANGRGGRKGASRSVLLFMGAVLLFMVAFVPFMEAFARGRNGASRSVLRFKEAML
eukprot:3940270-Rhodomonas_salina.3